MALMCPPKIFRHQNSASGLKSVLNKYLYYTTSDWIFADHDRLMTYRNAVMMDRVYDMTTAATLTPSLPLGGGQAWNDQKLIYSGGSLRLVARNRAELPIHIEFFELGFKENITGDRDISAGFYALELFRQHFQDHYMYAKDAAGTADTGSTNMNNENDPLTPANPIEDATNPPLFVGDALLVDAATTSTTGNEFSTGQQAYTVDYFSTNQQVRLKDASKFKKWITIRKYKKVMLGPGSCYTHVMKTKGCTWSQFQESMYPMLDYYNRVAAPTDNTSKPKLLKGKTKMLMIRVQSDCLPAASGAGPANPFTGFPPVTFDTYWQREEVVRPTLTSASKLISVKGTYAATPDYSVLTTIFAGGQAKETAAPPNIG